MNAEGWRDYGRRQLDRGYVPPVPRRMTWGPWPEVGPGDEVLGDVAGRRLLDIGSGAGHRGALVDAVELSPTQHERAVTEHGRTAGVTFLLGDVVDRLHHAHPYDGAYAIGTLPFIDPMRSLPALRDGLVPGAPLVFSALHTNLHGRPPEASLTPRREMIRLRDTIPIPVSMWVLTGALWEDLLTDHGFSVETTALLTSPGQDSSVAHQLIRARRRSVRAR
ncbi:class I SAM-dependent methyltransferase [Streptomyces sp. NPDC055962]|uniref:class I SAM-dependent methyltransferase n=1 Tax=Streptomyces sp. NPDC055962 TaxID=3345667 RepID=UPI0035D68E26